MSRLPLLLLPGLLNDAALWEAPREALADIADTVVADLTGADTMPALARLVLAQAPAGPFALAGFSLGGYCALQIMRDAPERIMALALVDTSARPDTPEATAGRQELIERSATDFAGVVATLYPKFVHPAHVDDPALRGIVDGMAQRVGRAAFVRQEHAIISRADSRSLLADIACPTVVVCGSHDQATPPELSQEMAQRIPGATLVIISDSGHFTPLEQPAAVAGALRTWLGRAGGSR